MRIMYHVVLDEWACDGVLCIGTDERGMMTPLLKRLSILYLFTAVVVSNYNVTQYQQTGRYCGDNPNIEVCSHFKREVLFNSIKSFLFIN